MILTDSFRPLRISFWERLCHLPCFWTIPLTNFIMEGVVHHPLSQFIKSFCVGIVLYRAWILFGFTIGFALHLHWFCMDIACKLHGFCVDFVPADPAAQLANSDFSYDFLYFALFSFTSRFSSTLFFTYFQILQISPNALGWPGQKSAAC